MPCEQVTYSTLIDGCIRIGDLETAEGLAASMAEEGIPPNAFTYNTLLRGYCAAGTKPFEVWPACSAESYPP